MPEPGIATELVHFVKGEKGDADIMSNLFGPQPYRGLTETGKRQGTNLKRMTQPEDMT